MINRRQMDTLSEENLRFNHNQKDPLSAPNLHVTPTCFQGLEFCSALHCQTENDDWLVTV